MRQKALALVIVAVGCGGIPPEEASGGGGGTHSGSGGGAGGGGAAGAGGGGTHSGSGGGAGGGGAAGAGGGHPGGGASTELYTGGTRLKVRSLVGADGSRQQVSLWDSQRNEPCNFALASDGKIRCLPTPEVAFVAYNTTTYADPACTTPMFIVPECSSQSAKYGILYLPNGICTGYSVGYSATVHTVAASSSITMYYSKSGTTCLQTYTIPTGYSVFISTGTIALNNFVSATYATE